MSGECIFREADEQLRADGYHVNTATPEVTLSHTKADGTCVDTGEDLEYPSAPHKLLPDFKRHVTARSAPPLHAITLALTDAVAAAEGAAERADSSFESPIWTEGSSKMKDWGVYAHKAAGRANNSKATRGFELLMHLYEATRLVAASRQGALELAMRYLEMTDVLGPGRMQQWPQLLRSMPGDWRKAAERLQALQQMWDASRSDLHRAEHLKGVRCDAANESALA